MKSGKTSYDQGGGGASESDPLVYSPQELEYGRNTTTTTTESYHQGHIRARRSSRSPLSTPLQQSQQSVMNDRTRSQPPSGEYEYGTHQPRDIENPHTYHSTDNHHNTNNNNNHNAAYGSPYDNASETNSTTAGNQPQQQNNANSLDGRGTTTGEQHSQQQRVDGPSSINSRPGNPQLNYHPQQQQQQQQRDTPTQNSSVFGEQPLIEIPEEIYAVRKSALRVLKPLIKTWLIVATGFSLSALFGMVRWTQLVLDLPYWFVLLPSWASHVGLLWSHISSAKALSRFIAEANDNRQRPDSMDHLDRTEYLPLLQRSLKFGLKTGIVSFFIFVFEVLVYIRLAKGSISLGVTFIPVWIFVVGGLLHGLVCKTQHPLKLLCWMLALASMILATMRVDYGMEEVQWRFIISPLVAVLSISSGTLIYIVYGHQIGYYRLTEAQLTAGILYSMAALLSVILLVVVIEVTPLARPVEIQTRIFVVVLAPLIVCLVGMGAWAISRDEFAKLLLYGGQAAVHPRKLRLETKGWTSVESKGVATIPMFGEVRFKPLEHNSENIELHTCSFCACYPYEQDEEETIQYPENATRLDNIYLAPSASQTTDRSRTHVVD